jgi:hypothetical protein
MESLLVRFANPLAHDAILACLVACLRMAGNQSIERVSWRAVYRKGRK